MNADSVEARQLPIAHAEFAAVVFRMLSDATRVRLVWALTEREMSVNDLATVVDRPAPSVSQHLAKLRMARLVTTRREGTHVFYRVGSDHVAGLVQDAIHNAEHATMDVPAHHAATRVAPLESAVSSP